MESPQCKHGARSSLRTVAQVGRVESSKQGSGVSVRKSAEPLIFLPFGGSLVILAGVAEGGTSGRGSESKL